MRRLILLIIALATLLPNLALAYDVLVLQSRRDPAYDEVLKGFRFEQKSSLRMLVLSDYAEVDIVRIVREDRPRLILVVGDAALKEARKVKNTPVLAVMSLTAYNPNVVQQNLTAISMLVAPERYMELFRSMKVRRIGVIHNPARSGWYLKSARAAAEQAGIEMVVREVAYPSDTASQLASLAGRVDALWMIPDLTSVTRESTQAYFDFGREKSVPVISFSNSYNTLGAAASLEIDRYEVGRQADEKASRILSGGNTAPSVEFPARSVLKINGVVAKRLGFNPEQFGKSGN